MDCNRCAVWWRRGHGVRSAIDLLDELNAVDESARIEAKRASEMGKSVMEAVIAFANEPGMDGGYLLLGVDWAINDKGDTVYRAVGLPDPDKAQRDLATLAASRVLRRLRDRGLLIKEGSGSATYYVLSRSQATLQAEPPQLRLDMGSAAPYGETPPACNLAGQGPPLSAQQAPDPHGGCDPIAFSVSRKCKASESGVCDLGESKQ